MNIFQSKKASEIKELKTSNLELKNYNQNLELKNYNDFFSNMKDYANCSNDYIYTTLDTPQKSFNIANKNAIASNAIKIIINIASSLKLIVNDGNGDLVEHPVIEFLENQRSIGLTRKELLSELINNFLITGNTFLQLQVRGNKTPLKLININPVEIQLQNNNMLQRDIYNIYNSNNTSEFYKKDDINNSLFTKTDDENILLQFIRNNNSDPTAFWGMSTLQPLTTIIESFNEGGVSNLAMFKNGMKPAGIIEYKPDGGGSMSDEQFSRLNQNIKEEFTGSQNSNKPLFLEGGLSFKQIGLNNRDMEWLEGMKYFEKLIYKSLGIPLAMVDGDASTFNNYTIARRSLYEDTVFPLMDKITGELTNLLMPFYKDGEDLKITYSKENIPSLESERTETIVNKGKTGIYTLNELRAEVGKEPIEGAVGNSFVNANGVVMQQEPTQENKSFDYIDKL